jgi:hypothetical protein
MPIFLAAILGALSQAAGSLVGRVLVSLGIGYASFTGINSLLTGVQTFALAQINSLPSDAIIIAGRMRVGVAISMIFSAMLMRLTLNGLQSAASGSLTRMVQK